MSGWLAGAATGTLTIPPGTVLGGFADRSGPSTGTNDPLDVSALVLQAGDATLHLLTADLIAVDPGPVEDVAAAAGVSPDSLIVAASHTHSGPLGIPLRLHPASPETVEPGLRQEFIVLAGDVMRQARAHLTPAIVSHGNVGAPGSWSNRNDPDGPSDDRVRMLAVRDEESGNLLALALLVPSHPTILGAGNLLVSADLHGGIRRALRNLGAIDAPILTMTGAAGDISTRYTRRESSMAEVERIGRVVAERILGTLPDLPQLGPALTHRSQNVALAPRQIDHSEAIAALAVATDAWQKIEGNQFASPGEKRLAWTRLQGAEIQARIADLAPLRVPMMASRLGGRLNLVTIPGELFNSLGQRIEQGIGTSPTWVVGYANGYAGYLVDRDAEASGTYEALASPWPAVVSEQVVEASIDLVSSLADAGEE